MGISTALRASLLASVMASPAYAATYDSQWALENTGQHVCNFRGQRCTDGEAGDDIKYKAVAQRFGDCSAVTVAVLDTGADLRHPDLAANLLPGRNFVEGSSGDDAQDDNLHGTHVAGIIAGRGTPSSGVVGVCRRARLLPVKVGGAEGSLTDSDILEGINFAVASGARVVNGSFGGPSGSTAVKNAIARAKNTLFVFAAGNGDEEGNGFDIDAQPIYPASYGLSNIVVVAATDASDELGAFSNFGGSTVDLAAPGVNIVSTLPMRPTQEMSQYGIPTRSGPLDGTSMATPYVAGALTMLLGANPGMTAAAAKSRLLASVDKLPGLSGRVGSGGRLNLAKLLGAR